MLAIWATIARFQQITNTKTLFFYCNESCSNLTLTSSKKVLPKLESGNWHAERKFVLTHRCFGLNTSCFWIRFRFHSTFLRILCFHICKNKISNLWVLAQSTVGVCPMGRLALIWHLYYCSRVKEMTSLQLWEQLGRRKKSWTRVPANPAIQRDDEKYEQKPASGCVLLLISLLSYVFALLLPF